MRDERLARVYDEKAHGLKGEVEARVRGIAAARFGNVS